MSVFEPIAIETLGVFNSSALIILNYLHSRISEISGEAREKFSLSTSLSALMMFYCTTVCRPLTVRTVIRTQFLSVPLLYIIIAWDR